MVATGASLTAVMLMVSVAEEELLVPVLVATTVTVLVGPVGESLVLLY